MKQHLDREQAEKLTKLGIESYDYVEKGMLHSETYRSFSIGKLLEKLPLSITKDYEHHFSRVILKNYVYYQGTFEKIEFNQHYELVDNLLDALLWCIENKHVLISKEE